MMTPMQYSTDTERKSNLQRRKTILYCEKSSSERQGYLTITLKWLPLHIGRFQEHQLIQLPAHSKRLVAFKL